MLMVTLGVCYLAAHRLAKKDYHNYIVSDQSLPEQIFPQLIKFMCIMMIVQTGMSDWMEMISYKVKNDFYRCHRNIINSHILYGLIFCGLLAFNTDNLYQTNSYLLMSVTDLFCVSRVLFAFGYMMGALFELQSLRAVGFGLTFTSVAVLASMVFKFKLLPYFL